MGDRIVFFDLETGGLEPHHPDIQIGAVAAGLDDLVEVDRFEAKIIFDPETADPEALAVNCYDAEAWRSAIAEAEAVAKFAGFLKRHRTLEMTSKAGRPYRVADLAGHNSASFDGPRRRAMFARTPSPRSTEQYPGTFLPGAFLTSDTLQLALWYFKRRAEKPDNYRLSTLCRFFGLPAEEDADHDALAGARAALSVAAAIILGKRP